MAELRKQLEQIVYEWQALAQNWDDEDRKFFLENTALGKAQPLLFMSTTRVRVLSQCTKVLIHLLEAFNG